MSLNKDANKKKKIGLISIFLLLVLLLSACGKTTTAVDINKEETTENTGTTKDDKMKKISTVNGEIEIPVNPQRIVAEEYLGSLIALDVIPVGAPELTINNYYFKDDLTGVSDTGVYGKPSVENILALSPDLIITANGDNYEMLSKIAPTIVIPYGDLKGVHEELTYFGNLFDKQEEAEAWLLDYDDQIADAKAKVDAAIPVDASFSIMEDGGKTTWVYGDNFGRGGQPVYQALGRKPPAKVADEIMEKQWAEISEEIIPDYSGDYIIMTSNNRTVEDFKADPVWGSLPAIKNNHFYVWPEERSWYYDPIAVLAQLEELTTWLTNLEK
ncbi:ABC transporter substrate-binding protein [Psychrobacillus psychrodurans]|uniref:ABC transporter substrate-binding protein n=1 Tax=Psychrobacillus psychrodurans TaxID=126157 RepID=A0A9X3L8J5_9BACI|nr:ABC transporter substrate-binding protein [Psychrobacillus psychrodurans]MCZ8533306.1 ABC transporter substrate-binding protein [Psychrobacillus psychrodurans]